MSDNEVVEALNTLPIPAEFLEELAADAGQGFDNVTAADVAIPYYGILQSLSPQVARGPKQIVGARDGDIFNNVSQEVIKGDEGIIAIPCFFQKWWVEWTPRESGGGFVGQYPDDGILAKTTKDAKDNNVLPNGNHIVETAYHFILRVKQNNTFERAIIGMTSTQLKMSRRWLAQQMGLQIRVGQKIISPPPYSHMYPLKTALQQKDSFVWSGWDIGNAKIIEDADLYRAAKHFAQDIAANQVKVTPPPQDVSASNDSDPGISSTGVKGNEVF